MSHGVKSLLGVYLPGYEVYDLYVPECEVCDCLSLYIPVCEVSYIGIQNKSGCKGSDQFIDLIPRV